MTANLSRSDTLPRAYAPLEIAPPRHAPPSSTPERTKIGWKHYLAALYRFKWLLLLGLVAGGAVGVLAIRRLVPQYEVHATIWLSSETPQARTAGPIRPERLLNTSSWPELVNSYAILDSVALKSRLYVVPDRELTRPLFANFGIGDRYVPGRYELRVAKVPTQYELLGPGREVLERGNLGDSVGRRVGLQWMPPARAIAEQTPVRFTLTTVREAGAALRARLSVFVAHESSLLRLTLSGSSAQLTTETMNSLISEFMATASRLKKRNLVEFANTLEQQVAYAAQELRGAELALEDFRVRTITLPSEGGSIAAGLEMTRDPVLQHYFAQKLQLDSIRNDRESLERMLVEVRQQRVAPLTLWSVPSVHGAPDLNTALNDYASRQAALRNALQLYTEEHRSVIELRQRLVLMEEQVIPQLAASLIANLRGRELDLQTRVDGASRELRQIPTRTIEEMRLRRNVDVRQQLYTMLKSRYEEARLGEASALPDLSVLDYPALPQHPSRNTAPQVIFLCLVGGLGSAVMLALLLDRLDGRFRHPDQATKDLGLEILGVVPFIQASASGRVRTEQAWQITEAFRTIRLALVHGPANGARLLSVTSPASGDGKSLVASNLAVSLAKGGFRTLLIDADVRRGSLHSAFGFRACPGLTDYLSSHVPLEDVIRRTDDGLCVIPSGSRGRRAPELLASRAMQQLLNDVRLRYDAVIVDCAPLNAGVDAFALGALTTDLVLVMRAGVTDVRLAESKLRLLDRLPVRIVGTVLNAVRTSGEYRYYSYDYSETPSNARAARVTAPLVE